MSRRAPGARRAWLVVPWALLALAATEPGPPARQGGAPGEEGTGILSPASGRGEPPAPGAASLPVELRVPADFPFGPLVALARLPDTLVLLDATAVSLRRGRVDLLRGVRGTFGVRLAGTPSPAVVRLVRRLQPALVVLALGAADAVEDAVSAAENISAAAFRFELATPPGDAALRALRRLRPCALRLQVTSSLPAAAIARLAAYPGRVELQVAEDADASWLRTAPWPPRAALVLAPRDGNYLADTSVEALQGAARPRHVLQVSLPLARVEVAQLRRLPGVSLELSSLTPPAAAALDTLAAAQGRVPWPAPADGGVALSR